MTEICKFIIVSFYTLNTQYTDICHKYLMASLSNLNLHSDVRGVPNLGSWNRNTSYKPDFLVHMLDQHPNEDIVFVDADAEILEYPKLFEEIPEEYNFAFHMLDKSTWYNRVYPEDNRFELLTGTLFIRNNDLSKEVVKQWAGECASSREWEQRILQRIIKDRGIKCYSLPLSYCYIKSLPNGSLPNVKVDKVFIAHNQVSRLFKQRMM